MTESTRSHAELVGEYRRRRTRQIALIVAWMGYLAAIVLSGLVSEDITGGLLA